MILPALALGARGLIRNVAMKEALLTSGIGRKAGFMAPSILKIGGNLIEKTLVNVMGSIERGVGGILR